MSEEVGTILQWILDDINETSDAHKVKIRRAIQRANLEVVGEHFWDETVDFYVPSTTASQPFLLPANMKRIKAISDTGSTDGTSSNAKRTYYQDFTQGRKPLHPYIWYFGKPLPYADILQGGTRCEIVKGTAVVTFNFDGDTASVLDADVAGEWIKIGALGDRYKISTRDSNTKVTLTEIVRIVEDLRNAPWEIRPSATKRIYITDASGTEITTTTLSVEFQAKPLSVVDDTNTINLPDDACVAVYKKALQYSMKRRGWSRAAKSEEPDYRHALGIGKRSQPQSKEALIPKRMFARPPDAGVLSTRSLRSS